MHRNMMFALIHIALVAIVCCNAQSIPELCNEQNQSTCECGSGVIQTYVFEPGPYTRCIHTYIPSFQSPLPVLVFVEGYGQGTLRSNDDFVAAAQYYGFAVLGIGSTGPFDGAGNFGLEFPSDGVINPSNPTPCSESDSREYNYIKGLFDFIDSRDDLDSSKVYFSGFSQNSMFAAYVSVCFADRVVGLWQGGSGLAKTYHTPITPGLQGQCLLSDFLESGRACCQSNFCTDCKWWPIYPRTCNEKLVDCIATYTNDFACGSDYYMYEAMAAEGNDARMLSFIPSGAFGGHSPPENAMSWTVGCLGIVESCSNTCEQSFLSCISSNGADEFARCENELSLGNLANCEVGCAPTLEMLKTSEPVVASLSEGKFGTQSGLDVALDPQRPDCENEFGSFDEVSFTAGCNPPSDAGPAEGTIEPCDDSTPVCVDSPLRFRVIRNDKIRWKTCEWVATRSTKFRCGLEGVGIMCPDTCADSCSSCTDATLRFKVLLWNGKTGARDCGWVKKKNTLNRCKVDGVSESCRATCGVCSRRKSIFDVDI